jgi:hypothetical protein
MFAPVQGSDALPATVRTPPQVSSANVAGARARGAMRSANDSHIRLRAQSAPLPRATEIDYLDAQDLLDELCEDQLMLSMNLTCLEELVAAAPPPAAARAALRTLAARLADLAALRDALANVQLSTIDPRLQRIAVPDSPLADYLRGIYSWSHAVVRALDHLVGSLRGQPDWALLRWRLEEAKNFHFDELHEAIRADLMALRITADGGSFGANRPPVEELQYAVERLISTAVALEEHLEERFG